MARTSIDALSLNKTSGDTSTASRHGGTTVPQPTFYKPSYKTLNYITWNTDVSGQVEFAQAVGKTGQKLFESMASLKEDELLSSKYDEIHQTLQKAGQDWKSRDENQTGEGYLAYISAEHAKLSEQALSGILDPTLAGKMRNMLTRSKADWENGAFEEEQAMRTAYSLRLANQTISNLNFDVVNNPATYESGLEAMRNALEGYKKVAGVQAYNKVYDESLKNFTYSYGLGLVQKDPANFDRLAKDGRLSVITPERLLHLQHMAKDELKRRAFESKRAQKMLDVAELRDKVTTSIQMTKKMLQDGYGAVTDTDVEAGKFYTGMKSSLVQTKQNIEEYNKKQLESLDKALSSIKNGEGISFLQPHEQLAFLDMILPTDDNGNRSQSYSDKITIAAKVGCTATDKQMSYKIDSQIMNSPNAEKVLNAISARQQSADANDILLASPSEDVRYVMGMVKYRGADPETAIAVRDAAKDRLEKLKTNPGMREALAEYAEAVKGTEQYRTAVNNAWGRVEEEMFTTTWFTPSYEEKQKAETKQNFNAFFRMRVKSLVANGWETGEAASEATEEYLTQNGPTSLVKGKIMFNPPERVYPNMTPQTLQKKFKKAVETIISTYKKNKYKPLGYELELNGSGVIHYKNGDEEGGSKPNLEWNPRTKKYNLYIIKEDGGRLYLSTPQENYALFGVDFNAIDLGENG